MKYRSAFVCALLCALSHGVSAAQAQDGGPALQSPQTENRLWYTAQPIVVTPPGTPATTVPSQTVDLKPAFEVQEDTNYKFLKPRDPITLQLAAAYFPGKEGKHDGCRGRPTDFFLGGKRDVAILVGVSTKPDDYQTIAVRYERGIRIQFLEHRSDHQS